MNKRALFAALALLPLFAQAEIKTIKDVLGREVKVDVPVKRAVLAFYYPDYIAVTGADKFKNVIGISREFWEKFNPGSWAMFKQKLPTLQNIADIGNISTGTFSLEKTLALKPDVLILADWQYKAVATHLPRIKAAGIPVVVVDFNAETVARHTRSAEIFGELNGTQARAQKIAAEYARGIADIQKRVARAKQSKPKIYIEFGDKGPAEHSFTFGKNMWGAIADTVGGDNIAAAFIKDWGAINPEQFLAAKPDVVIISGTEAGLKQPAAMAMGIGIEAAEAQKRLQGFIRRAGWAEIPAVRNGRVFGIYHTASRSLSDLASAQFIAKALYPEAFADVNPEETYREFHRKCLPVEPKGTFFIRLGCDGLEDCNKQAAADTVAASAETVAEPSLWQRIKNWFAALFA